MMAPAPSISIALSEWERHVGLWGDSCRTLEALSKILGHVLGVSRYANRVFRDKIPPVAARNGTTVPAAGHLSSKDNRWRKPATKQLESPSPT